MNIIDFFSRESIDLHSTPEQLQRQDRLSELRVNALDKTAESGIVVSGSGEAKHSYETTLTQCQCTDFRRRHLPCKHIYKLASELRYYRAFPKRRSLELIADFSKGYAAGWAFIVRPCNYPSLDITYSPITRDINGEKKTENLLTQGDLYNFHLGQVFYPDLIAYKPIPWGDALKSLRCSLQVDNTTSSFFDFDISYGEIPPTTSDDEGQSTRQGICRRYIPIYGLVHFSLYRPNQEKTREEKVQTFSCQQDEFLRLLKTGKFIDIDGKEHVIIDNN